jgi:hypothetical protein
MVCNERYSRWRRARGCGARWSRSTIGRVEVSRDHVVHILRRAGFREVADKAAKELPVALNLEDAMNWAQRHGVTESDVVSQLGGSP